MNASRFLTFFVALLLLLVVGGILAADEIAKTAVEKGGRQALGVETSLGGASIGLLSGEFALTELTVDNPPGYQAERFLEMDSGKLVAGLRSLMGDQVVAPLLAFDGVRLSLESKGTATNFGQLLENLEQVVPTGDQDADADRAKGKTFRIDRIEMRNIEVAMALGVSLLDTDAKMEVPELILTDLSSEEFTLEELASYLVRALLEYVSTNGADLLDANVLGDLQDQLDEVMNLELDASLKGLDSLKDMGDLGETGEQLKGLFNRD